MTNTEKQIWIAAYGAARAGGRAEDSEMLAWLAVMRLRWARGGHVFEQSRSRICPLTARRRGVKDRSATCGDPDRKMVVAARMQSWQVAGFTWPGGNGQIQGALQAPTSRAWTLPRRRHRPHDGTKTRGFVHRTYVEARAMKC